MAECEICGLFEGRHAAEFHRLADRIAKLEAWHEEMVNPRPAEDAPARGMAKPVHRSGTHFAEQPVSAADEVLCAPECRSNKRSGAACDCGKPRSAAELIERLDEYAAKQPPAPAQGAPAEPLSATYTDEQVDMQIRVARHLVSSGLHATYQNRALAKCADQRDDARARLAAAERELDEAKESAKAAWQQRDYAVAISDAMRCERDGERERCLYHVETYEPRRDVPADWSVEGAMTRIAKVIRDGEPAPK